MQWTGNILDVLLLLGVVIGTLGVTLYAAISVSNALRLRNVRTSWRCGKLGGYSIAPALLLGTSLMAMISVIIFGLGQYFLYAGCAVWIAINWFSASLLTSRRYITDHGIVSDINNASDTVAWHQIADYVELNSSKRTNYLFLVRTANSADSSTPAYKRLDLDIPSDQLGKFRKIVSYKLGKTVDLSINLPEHLKTVK